jgi:DNA-binding response OmpR family regulator
VEPVQETTLGNLRIDFQYQVVYLNGHFVDLSVREFQALQLLVDNRDHVLSYQTFTEALWKGSEHRHLRNLSVLMHRLRVKLTSSSPYLIKTLRSRGYGFIREENIQPVEDLVWRAG